MNIVDLLSPCKYILTMTFFAVTINVVKFNNGKVGYIADFPGLK